MTALRLTRLLACATVIVAGVLLTLGWLVTSFRAGMADPVWPTEPWFLVMNGHVWQESKAGFLLEHTHRLAGFTVGGLATLLAIAAWFTDRRPTTRWAGLFATAVLVSIYGQFHRQMGVAWTIRQSGGVSASWPATTGCLCLAAAGLLGLVAGFSGGPQRWVRRLACGSLVAVMVQGLLGGYRVYLDQLVGVELAVVHGTFGQVVFCMLVVTLVLTRPSAELPLTVREQLGRLSLVLPAAVFVQLVWGVVVRHSGTPLMQRLHFLTAFVVTGLAVWLAVRTLATPLRGKGIHLLGIVAAQVVLGVEAWMGKFAAVGPEATVPPMLRHVTVQGAATRTLHALIGAALLVSTVVLALRVWRQFARPVDAKPE